MRVSVHFDHQQIADPDLGRVVDDVLRRTASVNATNTRTRQMTAHLVVLQHSVHGGCKVLYLAVGHVAAAQRFVVQGFARVLPLRGLISPDTPRAPT